MLWYVLGAAVAAVVIFLAVIVLRAVQFRPKPELTPSAKEVTLEEEKIVKDMQEMIRCRTVSYNDASQIDEAEFEKFRKLLPELYPRIHEIC
ncbi:MAG: peptidase M20, partial [Lachnospiraceae bacterium]|nr:peptidase M20 [Lachnospiraceae bacterium]